MAEVVSKVPVGSWTEVCKGCYHRIRYHPGDLKTAYDELDRPEGKYVVCPNCNKSSTQKTEQERRYEDDTYY